jgi:Bacterial Ig-like domain (group 2)
MSALSVSRLITVLGLAAAAACSEPFSPPPNTPSEPTDGSGLSIVPSNATIAAGQMVKLQASMHDEFGDDLIGVTVQWSSSNPAVATVAENGEVLGRSQGTATISANAEGKRETSAIHVVGKRGKNGDSGL